MADEEKINVLIQASQTVRYSQVKKMTREEWEKIKAMPPDDAAEFITEWLDLRDVYDSDPIEGDDFEAYVVNENGDPVKPSDEYVGDDE